MSQSNLPQSGPWLSGEEHLHSRHRVSTGVESICDMTQSGGKAHCGVWGGRVVRGPLRWRMAPPRTGGERAVWLDVPSLDTVCRAWSLGGSPTAGRSLTSEKVQTHFKPHLGVRLLVGSGKGSALCHYGVDCVLN